MLAFAMRSVPRLDCRAIAFRSVIGVVRRSAYGFRQLGLVSVTRNRSIINHFHMFLAECQGGEHLRHSVSGAPKITGAPATWTRFAHPTIIASRLRFQVHG